MSISQQGGSGKVAAASRRSDMQRRDAAATLEVREGTVTPYLAKPKQPRYSRESGNPVLPRPLGDVCNVLAGYGFPERLQGKQEGELPFFKVGDISEAWKRGDRLLTKANHYLSRDEAASIRAKPFPTETVVFAKIGAAIALNRRAILTEPSLLDNNVMGLSPATSELDARYLFHFMCTVQLDKLARATTVPSIRKGDVEQIEIPVPPRDEQRRIVAELETHLTRLDASVTALKRVQANLKRYRASVLKAACEGRLVTSEAELARREGNASDQVNRTSPASYTPQLPEGWRFTTVGDVAERVQFGSSAKTSENGSGGMPVLRMGNIFDGSLDLTELKYLPADHSEFPELLLEAGDLLFNRTNSAELVGKTAVYQGRPEKCSFASYLIRVRLSNQCMPQFLSYYINSLFGRAWIKTVVNQQVGQANVNGTKLKALVVPLPPLAEQHRIVAEVERRLSVIEELEVTVASNLKRAARLRQSVLVRAFAG